MRPTTWERTPKVEISRPKPAGLWQENAVTLGPRVDLFGLVSRDEGKFSFETITHEADGAREKFSEALSDYLASVIGDPLFMAATKSWYTESDAATEAMDTIEAISGWLQGAVDTPFTRLGTALGLSPGEAAITAGVSTNLILAPVTGPLDKAESYIGIGTIAFGLMTGGHGFVLAGIKPLLHQQLHHALAHVVVELLGGSRKDRPRPDRRKAARHYLRPSSDDSRPASRQNGIQPMPHRPEQHQALRPARLPAPQDAPETRRQPEPREPMWLCLVFVAKPSASSAAARPTSPRTAAERDATKPVVLSLCDDAFLRTLPEVLQGGSVTEVDQATAQTLLDPYPGQHFVLAMEGVGLGTVQTHRGSQAAYQHPGCQTGRCVPPGSPPCLCPCGVCRPVTHVAPPSRQAPGGVVPSPHAGQPRGDTDS